MWPGRHVADRAPEPTGATGSPARPARAPVLVRGGSQRQTEPGARVLGGAERGISRAGVVGASKTPARDAFGLKEKLAGAGAATDAIVSSDPSSPRGRSHPSSGRRAHVGPRLSGRADVLALRARGATRSARISGRIPRQAVTSRQRATWPLRRRPKADAATTGGDPAGNEGGVSRRGHLLGRGQLVATPSSSVTDFGCDYWCDDQNRFWACDLGGRRSIECREVGALWPV